MSTASNASYKLLQQRTPAYREIALYEATFRKYEKWDEHLVVDGKPVTIEKEGWRTYSTGPYNIGRNKKKRELKAVRKAARRDFLGIHNGLWMGMAFVGKWPKWKHPMRSEFLNA
jgi:hypothetical protein